MESSATSLRQYKNLQNDQLSFSALESERHASIQLYLTVFNLGIRSQLSLGSSVSEEFIMIGSRGSSDSILTMLGAVLLRAVFICLTGPTKTGNSSRFLFIENQRTFHLVKATGT
jgi:hypothetical protein